MSGGKNYANYREELLRLMNQLEENQNVNVVNGIMIFVLFNAIMSCHINFFVLSL